jgi:hypothetical protein
VRIAPAGDHPHVEALRKGAAKPFLDSACHRSLFCAAAQLFVYCLHWITVLPAMDFCTACTDLLYCLPSQRQLSLQIDHSSLPRCWFLVSLQAHYGARLTHGTA